MSAPSIPERERAKVVAAMSRRHLTCQDVARMTGLNVRTIQRFVRAETFHLETLAHIEAALRLPVSDAGTPTDSDVGKRGNPLASTSDGPIVGWEQAARVLGIHRWTLWARRTRHGDETREPWWRSRDAVVKWYQRLVGVDS